MAHQATVPSRFRVQVNHRTQEPPFEFLPTALGIRQGASWRMQIPTHRHQDHIRREAKPGEARPQRGHSGRATMHQPSLPARGDPPTQQRLRHLTRHNSHQPPSPLPRQPSSPAVRVDRPKRWGGAVQAPRTRSFKSGHIMNSVTPRRNGEANKALTDLQRRKQHGNRKRLRCRERWRNGAKDRWRHRSNLDVRGPANVTWTREPW